MSASTSENPASSLSLQEKLVLRKILTKWTRSPHLYGQQLADANRALEQARQPGWSLAVKSEAIVALPPKNLRLSAADQKRFLSKLARTKDEASLSKIHSTMAACVYSGYVASISPEGDLVATPPKPTVKPIISDPAKALARQKRFYRTFLGGTGA